MNKRLLKEIRILPFGLFTVSVLAFLPGLCFSDGFALWISVGFLVFGSALVSSAGFGMELAEGTLFSLLAQPVSRQEIWFEKLRVLALALLPFVGGLLFLDARLDQIPFDGLLWALPVLTFCCGPVLTLVARSPLAGTVFTLMIPFAIELGTEFMSARFNAVNPQPWYPFVCYASGLIVISIGFYWLGFRYFLRLEWCDQSRRQTWANLSFIERFAPKPSAAKPGGSAWSIVKKELRLQQIPLGLAAVLCLVEGLILGLDHFGDLMAAGTSVTANATSSILGLDHSMLNANGGLFLLVATVWLILAPILFGAVAVAEERSLGMHGWQLALPKSALRQWSLKLGVVFLLTLVLGAFVPLELMAICRSHWPDSLPSRYLEFWARLFVCMSTLTGAAAAMYASSVCRTTLAAVILGGAIWAGNYLLLIAALMIGFVDDLPAFLSANAEMGVGRPLRSLEMLLMAGWMILILSHSFRNYCTVDLSRKKLIRQGVGWLAPVFLIFLLVGAFRLLAGH